MTALRPECVQDYPRPPALEPVAEVLSVTLGGRIIASTRRGHRVLETHHAPTYYFPPDDIAPDVLTPVPGRTYCEWKGFARYFDVSGGAAVVARGAWGYPHARGRFLPIAGYVAFYAALMGECRVGDHVATPQPGGFYGGWVTPNLTGTIKGAPGTEGW